MERDHAFGESCEIEPFSRQHIFKDRFVLFFFLEAFDIQALLRHSLFQGIKESKSSDLFHALKKRRIIRILIFGFGRNTFFIPRPRVKKLEDGFEHPAGGPRGRDKFHGPSRQGRFRVGTDQCLRLGSLKDVDTVPQGAGAVQLQIGKSFFEPLQLRGELGRRDPFRLHLPQIALAEFRI